MKIGTRILLGYGAALVVFIVVSVVPVTSSRTAVDTSISESVKPSSREMFSTAASMNTRK